VERIEVHGADEFGIKLDILYHTLDQAGEAAGHKSAEDIAKTARYLMPVGPIEGGHVRDTARAEGMEAIIGGAFFPYTGWLEFGGRVGKVDLVTGRYGIYRERKMPYGRYLYPSYVMHRRDVDFHLERETEQVIRRAGLDPS
jgi:hypothetical protein